MKTLTVTCRAPINIAVIKYWGKRDEELIIPWNDSISVTLDMDSVYTETTVSVSEGTGKIEFTLNGKESIITDRIQKVLKKFSLSNVNLKIASKNTFPTAAGMASSASGMAALAVALHTVFDQDQDPVEVSRTARLGSGSACRSIFGGFVKWHDDHALQLQGKDYWPELRCLILIVEQEQKKTSSKDGMRRTVRTSQLYKHRLEQVPRRCEELETAIKGKDFEKFAEICMKESNQLHAVCLDTFPPIHYLNQTSFDIMDRIHDANKDEVIAAYTFDAGPNAFIFTLKDNLQNIQSMFQDLPQVVCRVGGKPIVESK